MTVILYQATQYAEENDFTRFRDQNFDSSKDDFSALSDATEGVKHIQRDSNSHRSDMDERFGQSHPEGECFGPRHRSVVKFLIESMKSAEMEMLESTLEVRLDFLRR
jgi:hypothetical protein